MPIRTSRPLLGLLAGLGLFLVAGCGSETDTGASDTPPPAAPATPAPATANGELPAATGQPAATSAEATTGAASTGAIASTGAAASQGGGEKLPKNPIVELDTSMGKIRIQLDSEKAPISTKNFLAYVNSGHYNGTVFHRVIEDFMVQGGGFSAEMNEKPTREPIKNEGGNGLKNARGTVAMARTSVPDSASAQFFINVKDNDFLNRESSQDGAGYAVFGKVVSGMDVVDKIRKVKTGVKNTPQGPMDDVPVTPVVIKTAKVVK